MQLFPLFMPLRRFINHSSLEKNFSPVGDGKDGLLTKMKWIGLVLVGIIGVSVGLLRSWPLINVVETGRTPEYPDLIPRQYRATMAHVYDSALHAVNRIPRWSLVTSSEDKGEIHAESRTKLWRFIDDVVIRITKSDHTIFVNVRSASRLGQGDFGQNARNIRRFFKELDEQVLERSVH